MSASLKISEQGLLLYQPGGELPVTIIDFNDFFGNLGAIPLHSLNKNAETIPVIIRNIADEYNEKSPNMEKPLDMVSVMLIVCLLIKHSMNSFNPCKILEIGCQYGSLSYFLTKTAVAIHQGSKVFCLSEVLYGQSFMKILSELGGAVTNLSLLTAGKETDMLRDNYFDFVVINGEEFMENPSGVIANAVRIVRIGGRLLCLTHDQHLLNSCFVACVNGYDEYFVTSDSSILVKVIDKKDKETIQNLASSYLYDRMRNLDGDVCRILEDVSAAASGELESAVSKINQMENIAVELFAELEDIELKYVLNSTKEILIDYIYTSDETYKKKCGLKLHDFAANRERYKSRLLDAKF